MDVRKDGSLWWLRPDGKTQVTVEYKQKADGSVEPQKMHTVVISTQHAAPGVAKRSEECAGYEGAEMIAPSMEEMNKLIVEHGGDLDAARSAGRREALGGVRGVRRGGDDCTVDGGDEQADRRARGEEDSGGDHLEERQECAYALRQPHPPPHQSVGQVHHRRSSG